MQARTFTIRFSASTVGTPLRAQSAIYPKSGVLLSSLPFASLPEAARTSARARSGLVPYFTRRFPSCFRKLYPGSFVCCASRRKVFFSSPASRTSLISVRNCSRSFCSLVSVSFIVPSFLSFDK
jgi:hypothetical protein